MVCCWEFECWALTCKRLLKETGRFSNSPVFVVGIFSGADQLGEGFGASLRMAEYRVRSSRPKYLPDIF